MEKIQGQKHSIETLYYGISRMLERASYYGLRALVVVYMTGEIINMDTSTALSIYGWMIWSILFSQLLGSVLGDLLLGNKQTILMGGGLQAVGAFALCIPSTFGLYIGLFLIVLGTGFFSPNILANFGKSYANRPKLLDAGFTILYLALNLGAFFGVLLIVQAQEVFGYKIAFSLCGALITLSLLPILLTKENKLVNKKSPSIEKRVVSIVIALVAAGLFWGFYEITGSRMYGLQMNLAEFSPYDLPENIWQYLNVTLAFPVSVIAIVLWTYFYNSQFFKVLIGAVLAAAAFGILFLIPEIPEKEHMTYFVLALVLLAISEIHIAPIIHSILTQYANPKYLAIFITLSFIPFRIVTLTLGLYEEQFDTDYALSVKIAGIAMIFLSFGIVGYLIVDKKASVKKDANSSN
jgi:POT family proton-dependent oligopeptide transporter